MLFERCDVFYEKHSAIIPGTTPSKFDSELENLVQFVDHVPLDQKVHQTGWFFDVRGPRQALMDVSDRILSNSGGFKLVFGRFFFCLPLRRFLGSGP